MKQKQAFVLTGPTASGKSSIINYLFDNDKFCVVNCDALQVYLENKILSCQPSSSDLQKCEHFMYGYVNGFQRYSLGEFLLHLKLHLEKIYQNNKIPIILGGTAMYVNAILNGISNIPNIKNDELLNELESLNTDNLYKILQYLDYEFSLLVHKNDKKRIVRAIYVKKTTDISILEFWKNNNNDFKDINFCKLLLLPSREVVYNNCNIRLKNLFNNKQCLEEVEDLIKKDCKMNHSISKTIGFLELKNYINGLCTFDDALVLSQQLTRNYAKRQFTWFNNLKFKDFIVFYKIEDVSLYIKNFFYND